jgi:ribosomal protein S21
MEVQVKNGNLEDALRRFKRVVAIEGTLVSVRFRELFPNLSDRRKAKVKRAAARKKKKEQRAMGFSRRSANLSRGHHDG